MSGWRDSAMCAGTDPELWFPVKPTRNEGIHWRAYLARVADAKAICERCPSRRPCIEEGERIRDVWSIRGGKTADERAAMRRATS